MADEKISKKLLLDWLQEEYKNYNKDRISAIIRKDPHSERLYSEAMEIIHRFRTEIDNVKLIENWMK